MPIYKVLCRVDAFIDYVAEVEAGDPVSAARAAKDDRPAWRRESEQEFDARLFAALDESGRPIEGSECGDF